MVNLMIIDLYDFMKNAGSIKVYTPQEERINVISHAFGFALSIIALIALVYHAFQFHDTLHVISFGVFGISLVVLYAASTLYHSAKEITRRSRLKVFDHASIFIQIAGTYTPFTLITLSGKIGWIIFIISWGLALVGIILKLFYTGRYSVISTIVYVLMGWVIILAIKPLINNLASNGLFWLFLGGVAYTLGAILYSIKQIKFNHAIFHTLVLIGSICHFIAVYFYV